MSRLHVSRGMAILLTALVAFPTLAGTRLATGAGCTGNSVVCENLLPGNPSSEWDIGGAGSTGIEGFATDISVNVGGTAHFKVNTNAANWNLAIYRLGYYQGNGARLVQPAFAPTAALPQKQPACLTDTTSGITDCGNWAESASWAVPANAVSGIYIALLTRTDTGGQNHIVFVVRNDASTSDLLFKTSDTTWQAYNQYGIGDFYEGGPINHSYKVSYNRPFVTSICCGRDWVFSNEYPMIRFLEMNGYDVSYVAMADLDRNPSTLLQHKAMLSVGHDEYWSNAERSAVESARAAGVNLAFFSGNTMYWKTRWENSIDGSSTPYRTLVCYKETWDNAQTDPADPPT